MSEWKGKIIACDRCGKECRCKFLKDDELDGGFTHVERFEKVPEDWYYSYEIGWLCPNCFGEFKYLREQFMKGADDGKDIQSEAE